MRWSQGNKAITFSFDDGVSQDIRLIGMMNRYGLRGTFNLNSGRLDGQSTVRSAQVAELYRGHEVAVHTLTHPVLPQEPDEEVIRQVREDQINLTRLVGYEVIGMAYPGGRSGPLDDDRVAGLIANHTSIRYARNVTPTYDFGPRKNLFRFQPTVHCTDFEKLFALTEEFLALPEDAPSLFYIWGHSYEFDVGNGWAQLRAFFEMVANREDVLYCTNREALLGMRSSLNCR